MSLIDKVMSVWGGLVIPFPVVRGRGDRTYIYKYNQKTRGILATYKIEESWVTTCDIEISENEFRDLITLDDLFETPVIVCVEYLDRMVFSKVSNFYMNRRELLQDGRAFLPKEEFELLFKETKC